jgi:hypothetical protein
MVEYLFQDMKAVFMMVMRRLNQNKEAKNIHLAMIPLGSREYDHYYRMLWPSPTFQIQDLQRHLRKHIHMPG